LFEEAERIWTTNGSRAEFIQVTDRIRSVATDIGDPILYKTNLLLARTAGLGSKDSVSYYAGALRGAEKIFGSSSSEALSALMQLATACSMNEIIGRGEEAATELLRRQEALFGANAENLIDTLVLLAHFVFLKYWVHKSKLAKLWPVQEKLLLRALSIAEA